MKYYGEKLKKWLKCLLRERRKAKSSCQLSLRARAPYVRYPCPCPCPSIYVAATVSLMSHVRTHAARTAPTAVGARGGAAGRRRGGTRHEVKDASPHQYYSKKTNLCQRVTVDRGLHTRFQHTRGTHATRKGTPRDLRRDENSGKLFLLYAGVCCTPPTPGAGRSRPGFI